MVDLSFDNLLECLRIVNLELVLLRFLDFRGSFFALRSGFEEHELAIHLIFDLLQFVKQKFLVSFANCRVRIRLLLLLWVKLATLHQA